MKVSRKVVLAAGLAIATLGVVPAPAQATTNHTVWVEPGIGTISAAVATADPGDTIRLRRGTYFDSVFISTTLTIRGAGWKTIVKPPASSTNPCNSPGSVEGFCVLGSVDENFNPDTTKPVENVRISDLRVKGFSDSGVFGFNTRGLHVDKVRADHNGGYGIARFVSTRTLFDHNSVSYNGEAGLYMGDSPNAHSVLRDNKADHNGFGLFMRDSTGLTAIGNQVWGNCIGILALNTGGGVPAGNYRIIDNHVWGNNKVCPASDHGPGNSGVGIGLAGVHDTLVAHNTISNNQPAGPSDFSGGVVIVSTKAQGGADPTDNTIRHNELSNNTPSDLFWDGTGSGLRVRDNDCATAIPADLGWCTHDHG